MAGLFAQPMMPLDSPVKVRSCSATSMSQPGQSLAWWILTGLLNVAECELSCLTSQCLSGRRIGELTELQTEIAAWSAKTNANKRGVDWQFRLDNARVKLKRLYPKIKD